MRVGVSSVEDLKMFQKSHPLTLELYKITKYFSNYEMFGLISQIRRASSSICANMVEGRPIPHTHTNQKRGK
jgi:four helix bundle protein